MKLSKKNCVVREILVAMLSLATLLMLLGISSAVEAIRSTLVTDEPSAILADAGLINSEKVLLYAVYYDQEEDECYNIRDLWLYDNKYDRQFEWTKCGYLSNKIEQGLVGFSLGENGSPVATGNGKSKENSGINAESFNRWFSAVAGKSVAYSGTLEMNYSSNEATFQFLKEEFYPLDGNRENTHNHSFTMKFVLPFTALVNGDEYFEIEADDDTFVYVNGSLVIDMGGIHNATKGKFIINEKGEIYASVDGENYAYSGISVKNGDNVLVQVFHADRDSGNGSTFNFTTQGINITTKKIELKSGKTGGVEIAYNPASSGYIAPLGVTKVIDKDSSRGLSALSVAEGILIIGFIIPIVLCVKQVVISKSK